MIRIAIQAKGRLNEESIALLNEAGISIEDSKRKLLAKSDDFPIEVLYLRDDDIPQAVAMGVADLGIVGLNEVEEKKNSVLGNAVFLWLFPKRSNIPDSPSLTANG